MRSRSSVVFMIRKPAFDCPGADPVWSESQPGLDGLEHAAHRLESLVGLEHYPLAEELARVARQPALGQDLGVHDLERLAVRVAVALHLDQPFAGLGRYHG